MSTSSPLLSNPDNLVATLMMVSEVNLLGVRAEKPAKEVGISVISTGKDMIQIEQGYDRDTYTRSSSFERVSS